MHYQFIWINWKCACWTRLHFPHNWWQISFVRDYLSDCGPCYIGYSTSPLNLNHLDLISDSTGCVISKRPTVPCDHHIPSVEVCLWLKHTAWGDAGLHWERSVTKRQMSSVLYGVIYIQCDILYNYCIHFNINMTPYEQFVAILSLFLCFPSLLIWM